MPLKSRYNSNMVGKTSYGHNVLTSIISLATKEIKGVSSLTGRGVRTEISGRTINVDLYVIVLCNVRCADVAFRVQENVKRSVESMTEYKVGTINVNILGVSFKDFDDTVEF